MIFYGWNHVKEKVLGIFRGSSCEVCSECVEYGLIIRRTYFTLFFIPILCYRTEYYKKCACCPAKKQLTKEEAKEILDRQLPEGKSKLLVGRIIRLAVLVIVAGIFAALVLIDNSGDDLENDTLGIDAIKAMIQEDGEYLVYSPDGEIVADITVSENGKKANYYYEYYPITEDVPDGHNYECIYYYYEKAKNELEIVEDPAMIISDENFIGIKYHYYDTYDDEIYWYYGVEDFSDIKYEQNKVTYPMKQFIGDDNVEYYSKIRVGGNANHAILTFYHGKNAKDQNTLVRLDIILMDSAVNSEDWMIYYQTLDLAPDSTLPEILEYIEKNNIEYDERKYYEYYQDTYGVIRNRILEGTYNGVYYNEMQEYLITQQENGYYVGKLKE